MCYYATYDQEVHNHMGQNTGISTKHHGLLGQAHRTETLHNIVHEIHLVLRVLVGIMASLVHHLMLKLSKEFNNSNDLTVGTIV